MLVLWLSVIVRLATGFNLAAEHARVFSGPSDQPDSYFGFSVALRFEEQHPGILVGVPHGNSGFSNLVKVNKVGTVYWCTLDGSQNCMEIEVDQKERHSQTTIFGHVASIRNESQVGFSMDVKDSNNDFVVCSPHWKNNLQKDEYYLNGICYLKQNVEPGIQPRRIFTIIKHLDQVHENDNYFYAYGEAGFTAKFVKNDSEVLIGAPGISNWKGGVLRLDTNKFTLEEPTMSYPSTISDYSYLGYSVDYGRFSQPNQVAYVAGAPRGADYKGQVVIFDFMKAGDRIEYKILKEWQGRQMGEYFGATLVVTDLNQDGFDDIMVGAPQHALELRSTGHHLGDVGCVYIFIADQEAGWKEQYTLMGSSKDGARFGTAMSLIGDINMDGYPDVAIGAPYEDDGRGAIYIYHGGKSGLNVQFSQHIAAQIIDHNLRGFGASISKGLDIDDNYYNDLAVGAYLSNQVVLLQSYPVVMIHPTLTTSHEKIGFSDKQFIISTCISYAGNHVPLKIDLMVTLRADPTYKRAHFLDGDKDHSNNITLEQDKGPHCTNATIVIEELKDFYKPIDILMEYELYSQNKQEIAGHKREPFCKSCPVLEPGQGQSMLWKVPYGLGCKQDTTCSIDLGVEASFNNVTTPYIIGTSSNVSFTVLLESKSDPAYMSKLLVALPRVAPYKRMPPTCQENVTNDSNILQLLCEVDGPLHQGTKYELTIELDMYNVPPYLTQLEVNITAISSGEEGKLSDNHVELNLPLQTIVNVGMIGHASQDEITYVTPSKDDKEMVVQNRNFTHIYHVVNNGPSPVKGVTVEFKLPLRVSVGSSYMEIIQMTRLQDLYQKNMQCSVDTGTERSSGTVVRSTRNRQLANSGLMNKTLVLDCSTNDVQCMSVKCTTSQAFRAKENIKISFFMIAKLQEFEPWLNNKDILVKTSGKAVLTGVGERNAVVETKLWGQLPKPSVAWWIILVSVIGGIIILVLLTFLLVKLGFFKRDKQMQLQALKHEANAEKELLCEDKES